jgi:hypothetical protein
MTWKVSGRKDLWYKLRYDTGILLDGKRKIKKSRTQYNKYQGRDSNLSPAEYKLVELLSEHRFGI